MSTAPGVPVGGGPIGGGPIEVDPSHATVLATLHATAFMGAEAWTESVFATLLAQPGCFAFVDPAGGMVLARVTADQAEIMTLAVAPAARRHGVGHALVAAAMRRAAAAGGREMFLEVASTNAPARALYTAAGFVRVGRRARYYANGGDAHILRADLSPPVVEAGG